MAEDSDLERTEPATSRRLGQARQEGQVPRSQELGTFLVLLTAAMAFWLMGSWLAQRTATLFKRGLTIDAKAAREPEQMLLRLFDISSDLLLTFAPLFVLLMIAALCGPLIMKSVVFSPKSLIPKLSRMDPLQGIKRIISWTGLVNMLKAVIKALLIGGIGASVIWNERNEIVGLLAVPLHTGIAILGDLATFSFLMVVLAMLLIVLVDVPFQIWHYHEKLKMTREEVRQEMKEMEGDPHVKGRIRAMQRAAARRRMMSAVPTADVIVTNPTHFAVALAYKNGMGAPRVVAKGINEVARRIREIGAEHGVPLLEAPPLARALHRHVEIDEEIPGSLYAAVAEALAWVFQLNNWRQHGGQYPVPPRDLEVPAELVPLAEAVNG